MELLPAFLGRVDAPITPPQKATHRTPQTFLTHQLLLVSVSISPSVLVSNERSNITGQQWDFAKGRNFRKTKHILTHTCSRYGANISAVILFHCSANMLFTSTQKPIDRSRWVLVLYGSSPQNKYWILSQTFVRQRDGFGMKQERAIRKIPS